MRDQSMTSWIYILESGPEYRKYAGPDVPTACSEEAEAEVVNRDPGTEIT